MNIFGINWLKKFPIRIAQAKFFLRYKGLKDNWISQEINLTLEDVGYSFSKYMPSYLKAESTVNCLNLKDVCLWLINCKYDEQSSFTLDKERWASPFFLEKDKTGNCVDYSLWAWKKLSELGYSVDLFVGEQIGSNENIFHHTWVVFKVSDGEILLETTSKDEKSMVYNLESIQNQYIPWVSLDSNFNYKLYGGYSSAVIRNNNLDI